MQLTLEEVNAALFAIDNAKMKARRDGDLVQPAYKLALDRVLRKLREEHDRLSEAPTR